MDSNYWCYDGNQSVEAMDISQGRNTSTEDMEMEEPGRTSPAFFPKFISFTNSVTDVRNSQDPSRDVKNSQDLSRDVRNRQNRNHTNFHGICGDATTVKPTLSQNPCPPAFNHGWGDVLQSLDNCPPSGFKQNPLEDSQNKPEKIGMETNNNTCKLGSDMKPNGNSVNPKNGVPKPIRSLCGNSSKTNTDDRVNGDKCCMSFLFLMTSAIIVLTTFASIYIQLHFFSPCFHIDDFNKEDLRAELQKNLFGQEIAVNVLPTIINNYLHELQENPKTKPLVLSIHGWTGVGKNFVSRIIANSFYPRTFLKFLIPLHFPHQKYDKKYYKEVVDTIDSNITKCHANFILLDEMDKATPGVIKGLETAVINQSNKSKSDTPVIFLLLSNAKGADINRIVFTSEKERSEISLDHDFKDIFMDENSWFSSLNSQKLIDHFIPFLPLEEAHVRKCILRDSKLKNLKVSETNVNQILKELSFMSVPGSGKEYSKTGCKRVSDKVDLVMFMHQ